MKTPATAKTGTNPLAGWISRLKASRMIRQNILMFLLMLLFGFIVMNHIVSTRAEHSGNSLTERYQQRKVDLAVYEEQYAKLLEENSSLLQQKNDLISAYAESVGLEGLSEELEKNRILAGLTEVRGPGIILTLNDKAGLDLAHVDNPLSVVHDADLQHAIDLLINAGAAAFSINGNRYTNVSNIKCIGAKILCNNQRLAPPYIILALGKPDALAGAVYSDQLFNIRKEPGNDLVVLVEKAEQVVIPAYAATDSIEQFISRLEVVAQ